MNGRFSQTTHLKHDPNIKNKLELKKITNSGYQKVLNGNYEYKKIIESLLNTVIK
mgnify:CR=1 FL=1